MVTTEDMLQVATTFNCHPGANIGFLFSFYHKRFWNTSSGGRRLFFPYRLRDDIPRTLLKISSETSCSSEGCTEIHLPLKDASARKFHL